MLLQQEWSGRHFAGEAGEGSTDFRRKLLRENYATIQLKNADLCVCFLALLLQVYVHQ